MGTESLSALYPFALIAFGGVASVTRLVKREVFGKFPDFLFAVCYPCIILHTIPKANFYDMLAENAYAVVFTCAFSLVSLWVGKFAAKWLEDEGKRTNAAFSMMMNNTTYIGLPLAQLFFGARGVSFFLVCAIIQDIFTWTLGYRLYSKQVLAAPLKGLAHPVMVSIIAALALALAGVREIPVLDEITATFGSMTMPIALFYIGHILVMDKAAILRIRGQALALSALKTVGIPVIMAFLITALPIDPFLKSISILMAGLPTPLMSILLSKQFGKDSSFAVELLLCSTIMYMLVFPLYILLRVFAP